MIFMITYDQPEASTRPHKHTVFYKLINPLFPPFRTTVDTTSKAYEHVPKYLTNLTVSQND